MQWRKSQNEPLTPVMGQLDGIEARETKSDFVNYTIAKVKHYGYFLIGPTEENEGAIQPVLPLGGRLLIMRCRKWWQV